VGPCLKLEIALPRVFAVIAPERPLDIDRVGVVTFDQVAVLAIHRPHEIGQRVAETDRQGAAEAGASRRQIDGKVGQFGAVPGVAADQQRFHQKDRLSSVLRHVHVRFYVRFVYASKSPDYIKFSGGSLRTYAPPFFRSDIAARV
jgi:hypothetical protein